uniref:Uncharacterized protein n=1 Tax=Anopheles dirus TaxID=7168 RepID=A0A182NMU9_9DIPT
MKSLHIGSLAVLLVLVAASESAKSESAIFGPQPTQYPVPAASTFIVSDFLQFLQTAVTCFNKLRIPEERFPLYLAGVFPNCPETQCFVRCLSANLHLYCDETGSDIDRHYLQYGLGQDYNCFRQKAEQCLAANTSPCNDPCEAAYKQELCFLDEFRKYVDSNLNSLIAAVAVEKTENNPLPPKVFSGQEFIRSLSICAKILRIPQSLRELYMQGVFPNDDKTRSLIRCVGIRNELYDDVNGPNITLLYSLFGGGFSETDFRQRANICMNANQPLSDAQDKNAQAYPAAALLSVCALASVVHVSEANIFSGKTFLKAQQDCVQFLGINPLRLAQYKKYVYPPDRDTMCLIRCIGISLDFWDDSQGFNVSMVEQEFSPLVDASFKKMLADSITSKLELLDPLDNCSRAFYAFRTFRAQLRQLLSVGSSTLSPNVSFEPLTAVQILNNIVDCAREVNLPK